MPLLKIPKNYLITQDEKVIKAKGILKNKKAELLTHVESVRREWGE